MRSEINKGYETIADEYNLLCVKFWIWVMIWISNVSIVCDKLRGKNFLYYKNIYTFYKLFKTICLIYNYCIRGSSNTSLWENNEDV